MLLIRFIPLRPRLSFELKASERIPVDSGAAFSFVAFGFGVVSPGSALDAPVAVGGGGVGAVVVAVAAEGDVPVFGFWGVVGEVDVGGFLFGGGGGEGEEGGEGDEEGFG